ncbi:hypothetical protein C8F04DRAFT_1203434 [Mycena alexandri]|uniref:Uncharacterized protein n=1 Tax=Mycena alexandri TaxID=1745969 RepID=A0AAD6WLX9_9AGAR|nr:hypothetical protein C8F04DRAFT_1203434 [Mycena alexandri]
MTSLGEDGPSAQSWSYPSKNHDAPTIIAFNNCVTRKQISLCAVDNSQHSMFSPVYSLGMLRRQCSSCTRTIRDDQCLNKTEGPIPKKLQDEKGQYRTGYTSNIARSQILVTLLVKQANAAQLEIESLLDLSGGYEERRKRRVGSSTSEGPALEKRSAEAFFGLLSRRNAAAGERCRPVELDPNTNRGSSIKRAGPSTPLSGFLDLLLDPIGAANESGNVLAREECLPAAEYVHTYLEIPPRRRPGDCRGSAPVHNLNSASKGNTPALTIYSESGNRKQGTYLLTILTQLERCKPAPRCTSEILGSEGENRRCDGLEGRVVQETLDE